MSRKFHLILDVISPDISYLSETQRNDFQFLNIPVIIVHIGNFSLVCFVALHPKSTAMVMAGRPHFFLGKLEQAFNQYFVHILSLVTDNNPS